LSFTFDGQPIPFEQGDSVAVALLRQGIHPRGGGCICLAGDCPNCLVESDGSAYVRSCQLQARDGLEVRAQPGTPSLPPAPAGPQPAYRTVFADVVIVGLGESGRRAQESAAGTVLSFDALRGEEVIGIYAGPTVMAKTPEGTTSVQCSQVVVATGAAEEQTICPGSELAGLFTKRAAAKLQAAGVDLGELTNVSSHPQRFEGRDGRVEAVVSTNGDRQPVTGVVLDLGLHARDGLARMAQGLPVEVVGGAALASKLPPAPREGIVCPCAGVSVADLESVWERGFTDLELLKRATLAGTGTCQGGVCLPHLRSFVRERGGEAPAPFTARPLSRQATMAEVAAGFDLPAFRRTALHDVHLGLGAQMDRFGAWWRPWRYPDPAAEYWAVRQKVSLGDVSTLGKMEVSGPDAVELLERLYPCRVGDLAVGQLRYALLLDERGYVLDDGLICRLDDSRFYLTFTSGGASFAEMWVRDWAETFGLDVRVLDRTMSLGAINVTGPHAAEVLRRGGMETPLRYMRHRDTDVFGIRCRIVRLSFTGEASFELHHHFSDSIELWQALSTSGEDLGIYPHGLDALFTLRLEKGHFIVGMDSEYDSTPRRLGLEWAVRLDKGDFVGRQAVVRTNRLPLNKRLLGWEMEGPSPVEGAILWSRGAPIGQVTSARFSPILEKTVMLGWIRSGGEAPADVSCEGRKVVHAPHPFYDPTGERARG